MPSDTQASLVELADKALAWLAAEPGHGHTNAGIVLDPDGLTVIDCLLTPDRAERLVEAVADRGLPLRRLVYTTSHIEFVGGSSKLWMAARYGRAQTSALLDQPPNIDVYRRLYPSDADAFDDEFGTQTCVAHGERCGVADRVGVRGTGGWSTTREPCRVGTRRRRVVCRRHGDLRRDTERVRRGSARVGRRPRRAERVGLDGSCPGIGPIGGPDDVVALQAYLYACADAEGEVSAIPPGPWDQWTDRHFDEINVERAAMLAHGDADVPPSMLRLAGLA